MRLLVVCGSNPDSSRCRPRQRSTAPQPPGPGLPEQAPSVCTSTTSSAGGGAAIAIPGLIEAVGAGTRHAPVKAQLVQIFERILDRHQRTLDPVPPVEQPGQQEAQGGAAREQRQ